MASPLPAHPWAVLGPPREGKAPVTLPWVQPQAAKQRAGWEGDGTGKVRCRQIKRRGKKKKSNQYAKQRRDS